MSRQLVSFVGIDNASVKAKGFSLLLGAFVVVRHDVLLYIRQFCR